MHTLAPDEKKTTVMVYSQNSAYRGDVITKLNVRVSIWLRMEGAPNYVHLLDPTVITFGGQSIKPTKYSEVYIPTSDVIGFHITPSFSESLDFEESELNRVMVPVSVLLGTFIINGKLRISTHTGLGTSLEVARTAWLSLYEADITNPSLQNMTIKAAMMLVNPLKVGYALLGSTV